MKRLPKVVLALFLATFMLIVGSVVFGGGANFCIGNTTLCFTSE